MELLFLLPISRRRIEVSILEITPHVYQVHRHSLIIIYISASDNASWLDDISSFVHWCHIISAELEYWWIIWLLACHGSQNDRYCAGSKYDLEHTIMSIGALNKDGRSGSKSLVPWGWYWSNHCTVIRYRSWMIAITPRSTIFHSPRWLPHFSNDIIDNRL